VDPHPAWNRWSPGLGDCHWIIKEKKYDRQFVDRHTFGFEDWEDREGRTHMGSGPLYSKNIHPSRSLHSQEYLKKSSFRRQKNFHPTSRGSLFPGEGGHADQWNLQPDGDRRPQCAGWFDRFPGGTPAAKKTSLSKMACPPERRNRSKGSFQTQDRRAGTIPSPLLKKSRIPFRENRKRRTLSVDTLLLYYTNPLFSLPENGKLRQALDKVPFIVSFSPFMDETTASVTSYSLTAPSLSAGRMIMWSPDRFPDVWVAKSYLG